MPAALPRTFLGVLPSGSIRQGFPVERILILGAGDVNQAWCRSGFTSQAIQWFAAALACKDDLMTVIVPVRAALGFTATMLASCVAIEARAQDASPWQRDGHSAVRLLAGSRGSAVLLGGIAFQ